MKPIILFAFGILVFVGCQYQTKRVETVHSRFANQKDFICGMEVQAFWTDTCTYKGKNYAFCAASCKEEFLKNPEQYLAAQ